MKKYLMVIVGIIFVFITGIMIYRQNQTSIVKEMREIQENLNSYEIEGCLELVDDEALKKVDVRVVYQKQDEQDYYYVRLQDQGSQQVQNIIKNENGVFVISQGFNRAFQFQTEWPHNGFKPYILATFFDLIDGEYTEEKIRDGFVFTAPIIDPTHPNATYTQILFNQHLEMTQVNLMDEDHNEMIHFKIKKYQLNQEVDTTLFVVQTEEDVEVSIQEDLPMYPLESYQTELVDQIKKENIHVLRYQGDNYFTLTQTPLSTSSQLIVEKLNGDFYVYENGIILLMENELSLIKDGIQTSIYSNDLDTSQQLNVLLSMQNNIVIEP